MDMKTKRQLLFVAMLALIVAGAAAFLSIRATSLYGVGVSPDTTNYLRLAENILGNGASFFSEDFAVHQPPVYPAILAAVSKLTGRAPLASARGAGVVAAAALAFLIVFGASRITTSVPVLLLVGVLSCFSVPLSTVSCMGWTEPLFALIVTVLLLTVGSPAPSRKMFVAAAILTAAACLTRYTGLALIPLITIFVAWRPRVSAGRRLSDAALYAGTASAPFVAYAIRNYLVAASTLGPRAPSRTGLAVNMDLATDTVFAWFLPWRLQSFDTLIYAALFLLGAACWARREALLREIRGSARLVRLSAAFVVTYVAFLVISSSIIAYDPLNDRLLSPIYPPLLFLLAALVSPRVLVGRIARVVVLGGLFLLAAAGPVRLVISDVRAKEADGAGVYSTRAWRESSLLAHLIASNPPPGRMLYSNARSALYILTDIHARTSPAKGRYNSNATTGVTARNLFDRYPDLDGAWLIWFDEDPPDFLFTPEELDTMCTLTPVAVFEDGVIYDVEKRKWKGR